MNRKFVIALIFFALALLASAQSPIPPDPQTVNIAIDLIDLPEGSELFSESEFTLQGGSQNDYPALNREYIVPTPRGRILVATVYAILESKENARVAFARYPIQIKDIRNENIVGDNTFGDYPRLTVFQQDRAVIGIQLFPMKDYNDQGLDQESLRAELAPLCELLVEKTRQKLEAQGLFRSEELKIETVVTSTIASPSSSVMLSASVPDSGAYPVEFSWSISSASEEVLVSFDGLESTDGSVSISWDGRDPSGDLYQPGSYQLVIGVVDVLGRSQATSIECFIENSQTEELSLSSRKDSTIRAQKPHRNEGANPRLFLSHRLEARNKSLNPIVAFDLANTDLNGLTKATLVMNIQDCDLPRRWGNEGRSIEVHPMTQSWTEGNGNKYRQRGQEGRTKGEGTGVTWFSPADTQIRNNRPNGSSQWSGARMSLGPMTAPAVVVTNGQTGPIEFDVTQDVLNGYYEGWLLKKQNEAKFGNIRFFSKEAGDAEIAPKLLLEFNGPIAKASSSNSLLGTFTSFGSKLRPSSSGSELKTLREVLKESPTAARVGEQLLQTAGHINPAVGFVSTTAYRVWLS